MSERDTAALPIDVRLMESAATLLFAGLIALVVGLGAWWLRSNPALAVHEIVVSGDTEHSTAASLQAAVGSRARGNFFALDLDTLRVAIETAPWVRSAAVQREFPNRLRVHLSEYVPVARWGSAGSELVARDGDVFRTGSEPPHEGVRLPLLIGPDGRAPLVLDAWRVLDGLARRLDTSVATLELQPRGHWRVLLASGAQVELGQGAPDVLEQRFARFVATANEVAARHGRSAADVESVDLRYRNGYALRLRGVNTVDASAAVKGSG